MEDLAVGMSFEIPFVEVIHHLQDVCPKSGVHIQNLLYAFFFFLNLVLVKFFVFSVQLFQEIVQITFEPKSCVIGRLSSYIKPRLSFNIKVLFFAINIHVKVVKLVALDDVDCKACFLFNRVRDLGQVMELVKDLNH